MGQVTAAGTRCPTCSATVRPGAPWCTQCYAPAGAAVQPAVPPPALSPPVCSPTVPAPGPPSTASWPCSACEQPNDLADASCTGCGTPFLARLRDDRPALVLPGVGDVVALSPLRRLALAVGVVAVFLLVTFLLALLAA